MSFIPMIDLIRPHVLFNVINHGKALIILDFRDARKYKSCRLRKSVSMTDNTVDDIDQIWQEQLIYQRSRSVLLFLIIDDGVSSDLVLESLNKIFCLVKTENIDSIWSKIRSTSVADYTAFYRNYGKCESLFDGEDVKDDNPSSYTNEYPSEIIPQFLFLGSYFSATDPVVLQSLCITHIVDATGDYSSDKIAQEFGIEYLPIMIKDESAVNIARYFEAVNAFTDECRAHPNGRILIHCRAGISRSATFVLAYLLHSHHKSSAVCDGTAKKTEEADGVSVSDLREALSVVLDQRPYIYPNDGFCNQLIHYELTLFGRNSFQTTDQMNEFMSEKTKTSGLSNVTFLDRLPIAAAKLLGCTVPIKDEYPTEEEAASSGEVKPSKVFLKRGQGRRSSTVVK